MKELQARPATHTFRVERNYEDLYRHLVGMSRECNDGMALGAHFATRGELFHRTREAEIRLEYVTTVGVQIHDALTLRAVDTDATVVNYYQPFGRKDTERHKAFRRWAMDGASTCS
ncbi:MAG: hypothetical protein QM811_11380 [Pirellulales bacterium]